MTTVDSRLLGFNVRVTHPTLPLERCYCVNCGKPKGWVSTENMEFIRSNQVIVICDDCDEKMGTLPLAKLNIEEH